MSRFRFAWISGIFALGYVKAHTVTMMHWLIEDVGWNSSLATVTSSSKGGVNVWTLFAMRAVFLQWMKAFELSYVFRMLLDSCEVLQMSFCRLWRFYATGQPISGFYDNGVMVRLLNQWSTLFVFCLGLLVSCFQGNFCL